MADVRPGVDVSMQKCKHCSHEIAVQNLLLHESRCTRYNTRCDECDERVDREDLEEHKREQHQTSPCSLCHTQVLNAHMVQHKREVCCKRMVSCRYCEILKPSDALQEHEEQCGARTELCSNCRQYVRYSDQRLHELTNCREPKYINTSSLQEAELPGDDLVTSALISSSQSDVPGSGDFLSSVVRNATRQRGSERFHHNDISRYNRENVRGRGRAERYKQHEGQQERNRDTGRGRERYKQHEGQQERNRDTEQRNRRAEQVNPGNDLRMSQQNMSKSVVKGITSRNPPEQLTKRTPVLKLNATSSNKSVPAVNLASTKRAVGGGVKSGATNPVVPRGVSRDELLVDLYDKTGRVPEGPTGRVPEGPTGRVPESPTGRVPEGSVDERSQQDHQHLNEKSRDAGQLEIRDQQSSDEGILLPCEVCGDLIEMDFLINHQELCRISLSSDAGGGVERERGVMSGCGEDDLSGLEDLHVTERARAMNDPYYLNPYFSSVDYHREQEQASRRHQSADSFINQHDEDVSVYDSMTEHTEGTELIPCKFCHIPIIAQQLREHESECFEQDEALGPDVTD